MCIRGDVSSSERVVCNYTRYLRVVSLVSQQQEGLLHKGWVMHHHGNGLKQSLRPRQGGYVLFFIFAVGIPGVQHLVSACRLLLLSKPEMKRMLFFLSTPKTLRGRDKCEGCDAKGKSLKHPPLSLSFFA